MRLSASLMFLAVLPVHPQSVAKTGGTISPARIQSILQNIGLRFTDKSSGDSGDFAFELDGHAVTLHHQDKSMQLSACVADFIEPLKQNQWNRQHFSTRASLAQQGCVGLQATATFGGNPTNEMLDAYIRGFLTDVTISARFAGQAPADPKASPIGPMEWTQSGQIRKNSPPERSTAPSAPGTLQINRNISLKYDPDRWRQTAPEQEGQLTLAHSSGEAHAIVIVERIGVPIDSVRDIALANAQSVDPQAAIIFQQQRRINGVEFRFLKIEAERNSVPMAYWGCFYGGPFGTVQVVAYTAKSRLPEFEKEFTDLLNGITFSK